LVIELQSWTDGDLPLLVRLNTPAMTEHIGGPESPERLAHRLRRYTAESETSRMFKVMADGVAVGAVGFWDREWNGERVYETGWSVVPEFQGRGIASKATQMAIGVAAATQRREWVHAFPSVGNVPSNGICRKLGFTLAGEYDFEYPKGHWMRCNDWRLSLRQYT
jgi:RimJ/RimL family protein N-acetyltransferase